MRDYYYILGIKQSAKEAEIKTAYRKLSLKFHPDKNDGEKFFEERFKEIQEAYEALSNPSKRQDYNIRLNRFNSSNSNRENLKNKEEEIKRKFEEECRKQEEEIRRKYKEENRKNQEEIRREFEERERKIREDFLKQNPIINKPPAKNQNDYSIYIISGIIGLIIVIIFLVLQSNKQSPNETIELTQIDEEANKKADSLKTAENAINAYKKIVQDSTDNLKKNKDDEASNFNSVIDSDDETSAFASLTKEQLEKYYLDGKNDENVILLRQKFNDYMAGKDLGEEEHIRPNLNSFSKEYFISKFLLFTVHNNIAGGQSLQIAFINKPDRMFYVWILHGRIVVFKDADWEDKDIKKLQKEKSFLDPKYGF